MEREGKREKEGKERERKREGKGRERERGGRLPAGEGCERRPVLTPEGSRPVSMGRERWTVGWVIFFPILHLN